MNGTCGRVTKLETRTGVVQTLPWATPTDGLRRVTFVPTNDEITSTAPIVLEFVPGAASGLRLEDITGGRAITVARAQGSQASTAIVALFGYESRRLLYTAGARLAGLGGCGAAGLAIALLTTAWRRVALLTARARTVTRAQHNVVIIAPNEATIARVCNRIETRIYSLLRLRLPPAAQVLEHV